VDRDPGRAVTAVFGMGSATLLSAVTVIAAVVLVVEFRHLARAGEWSGDAWLGLLLVAASSSAVNILVTATAQWTETVDPFGQSITAPPAWAHQLQLTLYVLLLIGSVVLVAVKATSRQPLLNVPALIFLLLSLLSGASALLRGDHALRPFYLVFVAVLAATVVAPRGLGVHLGFAAFLAPAAVLCGLFVVVDPGFATLSCGPGKCGLLGFNARGFFDNENAFGMYLALAMPFVYLAFRRVAATLMSGYILFLVLLSGSRSASLAAAVTFVVLVIVRPDLRRPSFSRTRATVLYGTLGAAAVLGMVLPFTAQDRTSYTGRAYLWTLARQMLSQGSSSLFGFGALGWENVRKAGLIDFSAVYSVHNEWLQVLFTAGLVGAALLVLGLGLLVRQAGRRHTLVVGCVLAPVLCLAATERPWPIDVVDWLLWTLPGALTCYPLARTAPPLAAPALYEQREGVPTPSVAVPSLGGTP
jgi:O-Antigen ligase